jgi:hypothetical protein
VLPAPRIHATLGLARDKDTAERLLKALGNS